MGVLNTMFSKPCVVVNQVGLYAKAATSFVQKANEFKSTIWVEKEERRVNAKSLLGILSMGLSCDAEMNIIAEGKDEQEAVQALCDLVASGFVEK